MGFFHIVCASYVVGLLSILCPTPLDEHTGNLFGCYCSDGQKFCEGVPQWSHSSIKACGCLEALEESRSVEYLIVLQAGALMILWYCKFLICLLNSRFVLWASMVLCSYVLVFCGLLSRSTHAWWQHDWGRGGSPQRSWQHHSHGDAPLHRVEEVPRCQRGCIPQGALISLALAS